MPEPDFGNVSPFPRRPGRPALEKGGGPGDSNGMEERVARLETHMEYVRRDLDEIKGDLKGAVARLAELPTKRDLNNYTFAALGLGFAVMAIVIGGIIGGLALIARFAS
jgi:hypothetical protein